MRTSEDQEKVPDKKIGTIENWRKARLRQDRLPTPENSFFLEIRGEMLEVINFNPFGIAVRSENALDESGSYQDVPLFIHGSFIQRLTLRWVRSERTPIGHITAFEV